jgi:hypothetical protein
MRREEEMDAVGSASLCNEVGRFNLSRCPLVHPLCHSVDPRREIGGVVAQETHRGLEGESHCPSGAIDTSISPNPNMSLQRL